MRFSFDVDMEKGQCSECPLYQLIESGGGCALGGFATIDGIEPDECSLMEESEIQRTAWHKLVELWKANKDHIISESIEGFPTGNVYVGMTAEDYFLFDDIIDELMSKSSEFKKPEPIVWHPYSKEKPTEEYGYYLVTVAEREVHEAIWSDGFYWDDGDFGECRIEDVTAWAEMPKPYEE